MIEEGLAAVADSHDMDARLKAIEEYAANVRLSK
jgi:hypothetical protein